MMIAGCMKVLQADQDRAGKRSDPEHFHIVAAPVAAVCHYRTNHLPRNARHVKPLVTSIMLDVALRQRRRTAPCGLVPPLFGAVALHSPRNRRQRHPMGVRVSLTKQLRPLVPASPSRNLVQSVVFTEDQRTGAGLQQGGGR